MDFFYNKWYVITYDCIIFDELNYSYNISFIFQLYEIDDNPKRREFLDDLFSMMQKRGTFILCTLIDMQLVRIS